MKKRVSIWDDEPEELPVRFVDNEVEVPWGDLLCGGVAIALILFVGFLVGRWTA